MMVDKLIRVTDIMTKTALAKSTVWLWVSHGVFPQPIKLSPRVSVWRESDIQKFVENPEYYIKNKPYKNQAKIDILKEK